MRIWNRLRSLVDRRPFEHDLSEEMTAHREMIEREFIEQGMSPENAKFAASRGFGNTTTFMESSREQWQFAWLDTLTRDIRFALRRLVQQPALTITAALTIALGIGANTAIVSVLKTVLLNPLGLKDTDRINVATVRLEKLNMRKASTSEVEFRELQSMSDVFSTVAASEGKSWTMDGGSEPVRVVGRAATADFFRVFDEKPFAGRFFAADERSTVVLSHKFWRSQFGGDLTAVGRSIILDGQLHKIIGIAGPGFQFPADSQIWTSLFFPPERLQRGRNMTLNLLVRLKDGVSPAFAAERVNRYVAAMKSENPNSGYFVDLTPFAEFIAGDLRRPLLLLWAAALVVLLTGCANIATLLLSRTAGRKREMAIRISLGATRVQILRQLLIESLCLGLVGGVGGILLASAAVSVVHQLAIPGKAALSLVALDRDLILYGVALALGSGLVFGLAPAIQLLRHSQTTAMARGRRHRLQDVFVAAEVAAALVLLITTGLLLRSLWAVGQVDPGFDAKSLTTAYLIKPRNDPSFIQRLDSRLRATAGVQSAALAYPVPFSGGGLTSSFTIQNRQRQAGEPEWHGEAYFVSPGYFQTMRIGLLRGRTFTNADSGAAPLVCVIDTKLAERFFPDQNPLGQRIAMYRGWAQIIGVAPTVRGASLEQDSRPVIYYAIEQVPLFPQAAIILRTQSPATALIREAVRDTNGATPIFDMRSMEDRIRESQGIRRLLAGLVSVFAAICLILAGIGLNGVVSQIVGERVPEIGVRMALGAAPRQILIQFLTQGLLAGGVGIAIGLAISFYARKSLAGLLFNVETFDAIAFWLAPAAVTLILIVSVWFPARRASRVQPSSVLRYE
ncbi:MAG TPA: ADOP family duplicated permease [Bryobacteraceae bacterium]|nr:ADOP family duplicated permease [Bryobacteraceae bacterium]